MITQSPCINFPYRLKVKRSFRVQDMINLIRQRTMDCSILTVPHFHQALVKLTSLKTRNAGEPVTSFISLSTTNGVDNVSNESIITFISCFRNTKAFLIF